MKCFAVTALVVASMLAAAPTAVAEEVKRETMEKVVVTAGRVAEKSKHVSQTMTVISSEEIEKAQYEDMGELLQSHGIQLEQYGPAQGMSTIAIRGMRSQTSDESTSPILVLIDGRRAGSANVSMIPVVGIERIEILRGPAAVQYGATAIAGVVNVITKRGGEDLHASFEAGIGSWQTTKTEGGVSGMVGPVDFAGAVSWTSIDDDFETGGGWTYPNSGVNSRTNYIVNLGLNFLEEHRLGVTVNGMDTDKMGMSGPVYSLTPDNYVDRENTGVDVNYEGGYKALGLNWQLRYFNTNDEYKTFEGISVSNFEANNQGTQALVSWTNGMFTLTGGMDWLNNDYETTYSNGKSEYDNYGYFLMGKVMLLDERLVLSAGVRYDDYDIEHEGDSESLDNVAPSVGIAYSPLDWLTLRANYGESFRVPTGQEIIGYVSSWGNYLGNSNLDPEKGVGWDVGAEVNWRSLNVGLTYFQIDYEDKISTESIGGGDYMYVNLPGETKTRGIEAQASFDVGDFLDWSIMLRPYVNLTHLFKYEDYKGDTLRNVRNTTLSYGINFADPDMGLTADLRLTYLGHQYEGDWDYNSPTYGQTKKTGGETLVDLFLSKTLYEWEEMGKLTLKGEIRNMFDKDYSMVLGYPMPGRSFYLGLRYDY